MRSAFWNSAGPRFVSKDEALDLARKTARQMADQNPDISRILLFGSFAREDYGVRSDLDLLIILRESNEAMAERFDKFLSYVPAYPMDVFVYTHEELRQRVAGGDAFLTRALKESIQIWPEEN